MRLARLTGLERDKLETNLREAWRSRSPTCSGLLENEPLLMGVIKEEMQAIRDKFADDRRTELTIIEGEIDIEDLIAPDDMVVTMTNFGYIKRLPKSTYRAQHRGGRGISGMSTRDEDFVRRLIIVNTHEEIMFFTNRGRVYSLKCYQIPETSRTARGIAIVNLLALPGDEKVTAMIPVPNDELGGAQPRDDDPGRVHQENPVRALCQYPQKRADRPDAERGRPAGGRWS